MYSPPASPSTLTESHFPHLLQGGMSFEIVEMREAGPDLAQGVPAPRARLPDSKLRWGQLALSKGGIGANIWHYGVVRKPGGGGH